MAAVTTYSASKNNQFRKKKSKLLINPDIVTTRFRMWKRQVNQILPSDLHLKDNLSGIIWALARKAQVSYPNGLPNKEWVEIRTWRRDLKRTGLMECCEKTIYNQLIRLDNAGVIKFKFRNNSFHGTRTIRNTQSSFELLIPAWLLSTTRCEQPIPEAFLDELRKKQNVPNLENLEDSEKKLPLIITDINQNPNSINTKVDMLPTPQTDGNGSLATPTRQSRTQNTKNPEPYSEIGVKKDEPTAEQKPVTTTATTATPEPKEPESTSLGNQVQGSSNQNTGAGRGAGTRMREKMYGSADRKTSQPAGNEAKKQAAMDRNEIKLMAWYYCKEFWKQVQITLLEGKDYKPEKEKKILENIWISVFNTGNFPSMLRLQRHYDVQKYKLKMVEKALFSIHDPELYFQQGNLKSGFDRVQQWYETTDKHYREVSAYKLLKKAKSMIVAGKIPKGNPYLDEQGQYQYWRVKLLEWNVNSVIRDFDAFWQKHYSGVSASL